KFRHRPAAELLTEATRHQLQVALLPPSLAEQTQPVLRHRQMSHLPCDMRRATWRHCEPVRLVDFGQDAQYIRAGKFNLLQGKCQAHSGFLEARNSARTLASSGLSGARIGWSYFMSSK